MKKGLSMLLVVIIGIMSLQTAVCANTYPFSYSHSDNSVMVNSMREQNFLTVSMIPYGMNIASDVINNSEDALYKVISSSESLPYKILLSGSMQSGKYLLTITDGSYTEKTVVFKPKADEIGALVNSLNLQLSDKSVFVNTLTANALAVLGSTVQTAQAKALYNFAPEGGYSVESFLKNFALYEGMVLCSGNSLSFEKFICEYGAYIDIYNKEKYALLSDDEKNGAENNRIYSDFTKDGAQKGIENIIFLARIKKSASYENLKAVCIEYFTRNSVDMSVYNSITNTYYQGLVWDNLYSVKNSVTDVASVLSYFNTYSATQKQAAENAVNDAEEGDGGNSGGGGGGGGGSNMSFGATSPQINQSVFNDINGHWAQKSIEQMYSYKIVNGFEDGTFRPENSVTRAEYIKMIVGILGLEEKTVDLFEDVKSTDWYAPYIGGAYSSNLVQGLTKTTFAPNNTISRQDAAVIVYRAIAEKLDVNSSAPQFGDEGEIAPYAKEAVKLLSASGLLNGSSGNFNPRSNMTRAETATFLLRIYNLNLQKGA